MHWPGMGMTRNRGMEALRAIWQTIHAPAAFVEVDVAGQTVRLPGLASSEDAIARVEQHLHGASDTEPRAPPSRHGVL
jgi:hypothetical protein